MKHSEPDNISVSIIYSTRNRPEMLMQSIAALLATVCCHRRSSGTGISAPCGPSFRYFGTELCRNVHLTGA
jgi:hypothetical protein